MMTRPMSMLQFLLLQVQFILDLFTRDDANFSMKFVIQEENECSDEDKCMGTECVNDDKVEEEEVPQYLRLNLPVELRAKQDQSA